jgi:hypothetical protein
MKGFLIGCGVVALLIVGVIVAGGAYVWNRFAPQVTQGLQSAQKIDQELKRIVPGSQGLNFNVSTVNGKTTARVNVAVPFDPTVGTQPAKVANNVLRIIRENLPPNLLPAQTLEIRLTRQKSGATGTSTQERTFTFDLRKPAPLPTGPKI